MIVGVVVGLLIVAGLMGLIYWLYMKNSRCDQDSPIHTQVRHLSPSPEGKMRILVWFICIKLVGLKLCDHHRQGSWKTGEKDTGTSEENKKLEENSHSV